MNDDTFVAFENFTCNDWRESWADYIEGEEYLAYRNALSNQEWRELWRQQFEPLDDSPESVYNAQSRVGDCTEELSGCPHRSERCL